MFKQEGFSQDQFVWLLGAACQLHRIPFDPRLALQQFPPPHTLDGLRAALVALGFREGLAALPADELVDAFANAGGPCFVALKAEPEAAAFVLLLRCDGSRALLVRPGKVEPEEIAFTDLERDYAGQCLQFVPEPRTLKDDDTEDETPPGPQAASPNAFGFRWFVPELLKHKAVWREVLAASLAIQLVGLATPLFTQVIIDKVVVHQTLPSTAARATTGSTAVPETTPWPVGQERTSMSLRPARAATRSSTAGRKPMCCASSRGSRPPACVR